MENTFTYYIVCILAVIIGIFVIKKITGCIIKIVIFLAIIAVLAAIYYFHLI